MMMGALLLLAYGLCAWGSAVNMPAWLRLVWRGLSNPARVRPWWDDTLMLGRIGIAIVATAFCGLTSLRVWEVLVAGKPLTLSPVGLPMMLMMACADPLFLRVDHLHARASGGWSLGWRLYWAGAATWVTIVAVIVILP